MHVEGLRPFGTWAYLSAGNRIAASCYRKICFRREVSMSFGIYMIGFILLVIGLAIGASMMHIAAQWIAVGVICMIGLGILLGVTTTRQRDSSS